MLRYLTAFRVLVRPRIIRPNGPWREPPLRASAYPSPRGTRGLAYHGSARFDCAPGPVRVIPQAPSALHISAAPPVRSQAATGCGIALVAGLRCDTIPLCGVMPECQIRAFRAPIMIAGTFGPYLAQTARDHGHAQAEDAFLKFLALGYDRVRGPSSRSGQDRGAVRQWLALVAGTVGRDGSAPCSRTGSGGDGVFLRSERRPPGGTLASPAAPSPRRLGVR
jgi:hypothetical protein